MPEIVIKRPDGRVFTSIFTEDFETTSELLSRIEKITYVMKEEEERTRPDIIGGVVSGAKNMMEATASKQVACNPPKLYLTDAEIEEMFTYHPPNSPEQRQAYANINHAAKVLARAIRDNCPSSEDARNSINFLRLSRMLANSAIATEGRF